MQSIKNLVIKKNGMPDFKAMRIGMKHEQVVPVIFKRFPELQNRIPWLHLGVEPTPVERLEGFGYDRLWIKRDDLASPLYGGNKVRKLEFILGMAVTKKKRRVITMGAIGSNHGLATAIYCRKLGLGCTVLLFDQPITSYVKKNLRLIHAYNAEIVYGRSILRTALDFSIRQRFKYPKAYFLKAGGSNVWGTIGIINAAFELKEQVEQAMMPEPDYIFCPVGSNGTIAGLHLGCMLAGLKTVVIGVRVLMECFGPFEVCTARKVQILACKTGQYLKTFISNFDKVTIPKPYLIGDYFGDGYGQPTQKGGESLKIMKDKKGLSLDPCYTAKTFAAVLDFCKENRDSNKTVLFWNTYNSTNLQQKLSQSKATEMPLELGEILAADEVDIYTK